MLIRSVDTLGFGILTNLLSPWVFWLAVGAAILAKATAKTLMAAVAFLCGFCLLLVGWKALLALLVARSRDLLTGRQYRVVMGMLAVLPPLFLPCVCAVCAATDSST